MQSIHRFCFRFDFEQNMKFHVVIYAPKALLPITYRPLHNAYFGSFLSSRKYIYRDQTKRTQIFDSFAFASPKPINRWVFGRRSLFNIHTIYIFHVCLCYKECRCRKLFKNPTYSRIDDESVKEKIMMMIMMMKKM